MKGHPLAFGERVIVGAVCWFVLLILFSNLMPNSGAAAWVYICVSAVLVFRFVLPSKIIPKPNGGHATDSELGDQPETRAEFIDRLLAESEREAQAIAAIRERNPKLAEEIHDLYRQKMAIESQEDEA